MIKTKKIQIIEKVESFIGYRRYVVESKSGRNLLLLCMVPIIGTIIIIIYFLKRDKKKYINKGNL